MDQHQVASHELGCLISFTPTWRLSWLTQAAAHPKMLIAVNQVGTCTRQRSCAEQQALRCMSQHLDYRVVLFAERYKAIATEDQVTSRGP